ncbi:MAG TPA: haloacid dehalogenase-like hydrolase [Pseudobdellovibrionaceae bacterium]|nr:haloacid dehalogenase-like hydrolase [Pseudobdellovibrionaceae bacterium]
MKQTNYDSQFFKDLSHTISELKKQNITPLAAFDADGTLWSIDIGESFFNFLIQKKRVELPTNPWEHYLELKKKNNDPQEAYLWLAQICKNQPIETVRSWSQEALEQYGPPGDWIYPEQLKLIQFLQSHHIPIYIVSASITWAIEPGAALFRVPKENVLAVETIVEKGLITDFQNGPITYQKGKVEKLLLATQNKHPFLASGNTLGDQHLLESASHYKIAIQGAAPASKMYPAEEKLQHLAQQQGWIRMHFS